MATLRYNLFLLFGAFVLLFPTYLACFVFDANAFVLTLTVLWILSSAYWFPKLYKKLEKWFN